MALPTAPWLYQTDSWGISTMARTLGLLLLGGVIVLPGPAPAKEPARPDRSPISTQCTAEPAQVIFHAAGQRQQLVITGTSADGSVRDLTRRAKYVSDNPAVARVSADGVVTPKGVGTSRIHITGFGPELAVPVTVQSVMKRPVSFANDIMPILAKAGCNSGACHGSASGKKGFKVSLRGYDPDTDFVTLTRGTGGRRLNRNNPAHSLLVLKPTGQVPHEGGKRFAADTAYADTLRRWIAEGAASDLSQAPKLAGLEVYPKFRTFQQPGQRQQLLVTARFSDGSRRDVTADARFSSNNETTAAVDERGLVTMPGKGEAALMVRYGSHLAVSTCVVLQHDPAFAWANPPAANYIDRLVFAKLRQMEILPADLTTDEEFLRRVSYDLTGLPPTAAEVRAFLADQRADKRARVIDALLERPAHAEFWALKWGDLLKIRFDLMGDKGTWGMYRWLRDSVASNKPFDRFVREIITAEGSCDANPAANFWRVFPTAEDAAEATTQVFLGVRLLCAKCHDHPFEKWVQKDYYGMSAFFTQVGRKAGRRPQELVIFRNDTPAQARHPRTGQTVNPTYLASQSVAVTDKEDARKLLADWLTRKDNPFLARATVNRLWSHLFGKGIIDPVDDIRSSNPPVNGPLLDALTKDFIDHDFDVRHLLRTILNSRVYQLSARVNRFNADDQRNFSHALPRRLSAEQLLDSITLATGVRANFKARFSGAGTIALPVGGVRAGQLPDKQLTAELLDLFGRPRGESTCACERHEEASMTQALHLINGKSLERRLADQSGRLARLVKTPKITPPQMIEEMYLTVLCRRPAMSELALWQQHFEKTKDHFKAAQDLMWVLFNTKEFLFNH
jgi:hypothetical protein